MPYGMSGMSPRTGGPSSVNRNINPQTQAPYRNTIGDLRAMQRSGQELSPFQMNRLENAPGQGNLERVSPGVYRNPRGELVSPQGQLMPQSQQIPQEPVAAFQQQQAARPVFPNNNGLASGLATNPYFNFNKQNQNPNNVNFDMSNMQFYNQPGMMRPAVMPNYNPMITSLSNAFLGLNK